MNVLRMDICDGGFIPFAISLKVCTELCEMRKAWLKPGVVKGTQLSSASSQTTQLTRSTSPAYWNGVDRYECCGLRVCMSSGLKRIEAPCYCLPWWD